MENLDLKINKTIEVLYDKQIYKASIQDIKEEDMLITIPVSEGVYLTLNSREEIEQIYYDGNGNVFLYKTRVITRHKEGNIPFYRVSKPYDIKKIQRRNYVRVNIVQVINYLKKDKSSQNKNVSEEAKQALLLDLSGGGMKINVKEKLSVNDEIRADLIYEDEKVSIRGKIIRVDKTEDKKYICGIRFEDINNITREKIIRIVFKIMRKQRTII